MSAKKFDQFINMHLIRLIGVGLSLRQFYHIFLIELEATKRNAAKVVFYSIVLFMLLLSFWWLLIIMSVLFLLSYLHNLNLALIIVTVFNFLMLIIVYLITLAHVNNTKRGFSNLSLTSVKNN